MLTPALFYVPPDPSFYELRIYFEAQTCLPTSLVFRKSHSTRQACKTTALGPTSGTRRPFVDGCFLSCGRKLGRHEPGCGLALRLRPQLASHGHAKYSSRARNSVTRPYPGENNLTQFLGRICYQPSSLSRSPRLSIPQRQIRPSERRSGQG
jgi:hypothetical protein